VSLEMTKLVSPGFFGIGKTKYVPVRVEINKTDFTLGETIKVFISIDNSGVNKKISPP
jgi:hypothetical protein